MHRKMMMISGKQLHFDSMYKCHQVQTSYPSDAYTTGVAEDKIVLPPGNINPSNKGVPVLWTNTNDEYEIIKLHPSRRLASVSIPSTQSLNFESWKASKKVATKADLDDRSFERLSEKRFRFKSWPRISSESSTVEKEASMNSENASSSEKFHGVTLQDILLSCPGSRPSTAQLQQRYSSDVLVNNELQTEDEQKVTSIRSCPSSAKKKVFKDARPHIPRTKIHLLSVLKNKLEFSDRHVKDRDELIDRGLKLTKTMEDVILDQYFSLRPTSKNENRIKSAFCSGQQRDRVLKPTLLATGFTMPVYAPEVASAPSTKLSRSKTPPPGNLLRCLRYHTDDYKEHKRSWRY